MIRCALLIAFVGTSATVAGYWGLSVVAQPARSPEQITSDWRSSPHANIASESFTHWDKDGKVPVPCATCHSGEGFRDFVGADGSTPFKIDNPAPIRSVIGCTVCHNPQTQSLARVTLPSGVVIDKPGASAACMTCHQGRESGASVIKAVADRAMDKPDPELRFINVHYRAAAASLFGSLGKSGFEYPGKTYHGKISHPENASTCTSCHDAHSTKVKVASCAACHANTPLRAIRTSTTDFDGNGNAKEGIHAEIASLHAMLGKAIADYAKTIAGSPILYDAGRYPYYFADRNSNGQLDKAEATPKNAYASWTPRLLQAAYNYQFVAKEPGIYTHNPPYGLQLLYDSLASLNEKTPVPAFARIKRP